MIKKGMASPRKRPVCTDEVGTFTPCAKPKLLMIFIVLAECKGSDMILTYQVFL